MKFKHSLVVTGRPENLEKIRLDLLKLGYLQNSKDKVNSVGKTLEIGTLRRKDDSKRDKQENVIEWYSDELGYWEREWTYDYSFNINSEDEIISEYNKLQP